MIYLKAVIVGGCILIVPFAYIAIIGTYVGAMNLVAHVLGLK